MTAGRTLLRRLSVLLLRLAGHHPSARAPLRYSPSFPTGAQIAYDELYGSALVDDATFETLLTRIGSGPSSQIRYFIAGSRSLAEGLEQAVRVDDFRQVAALIEKLREPVETIGLPRLGLVAATYLHQPERTRDRADEERLRRRALALVLASVIEMTAAELGARTGIVPPMRPVPPAGPQGPYHPDPLSLRLARARWARRNGMNVPLPADRADIADDDMGTGNVFRRRRR